MSDALHMVVTIEISSAFGIEEPGSFAANDFGWLVIKEHAATQIFGSPSNEPLSAPVEPPIVREVGVRRAQQGRMGGLGFVGRSEEHTSELQSLMRTSYAVFCLKKKKV